MTEEDDRGQTTEDGRQRAAGHWAQKDDAGKRRNGDAAKKTEAKRNSVLIAFLLDSGSWVLTSKRLAALFFERGGW